MAEDHLQKVRDLFERYDTDKDDSLDLNELALLLQEISSKITPLPAVSLSLICLVLFIYGRNFFYRLRKSPLSKENTSEKSFLS